MSGPGVGQRCHNSKIKKENVPNVPDVPVLWTLISRY